MISVFTAIHPPSVRYLSEAYVSLLQQTYKDWEWILACNGGATIPAAIAKDHRVRVIETPGGQALAKATACHRAHGDVLARLDADDLLSSDALETIANTTGFSYGNFAPFKDCTWDPRSYAQKCGWQYRNTRYITWQGDHKAVEHVSWDPGPYMVASLLFAPCGLIAWDRETYRKTGGYELESKITPEHELLCKTYLECGSSGMVRHDKCLAFYRYHEDSTSIAYAPYVHAKRIATYEKYIPQTFGRWCCDEQLLMLTLDSAWGKQAIYDNTVGMVVVRQMDIPWDELYRVLAPGGVVQVKNNTESTDRRFHTAHKSPSETHFIALKGKYARHPVGTLPCIPTA